LKEIKLPEGLLSVGGGRTDGAFSYCSALYRVELPSTLREIGYWAFRSDGIMEVVSHITTPFPIDYYDFGSTCPGSGTLTVPRGTKELYQQTEGWKTKGVSGLNIISYSDGTVKKVIMK
jgi:hypothetical protein